MGYPTAVLRTNWRAPTYFYSNLGGTLSEGRPRLANRSVAGVDFQDRALQSPGGAGIVSSSRLMVMKRSDEP